MSVLPDLAEGTSSALVRQAKPNSIRSFTELAIAFVSRFQSSVKQKKMAANLLVVRQRPDESIRDYITRFNGEALEIKDLDDGMAFNALHNGVTNHDLVKSLTLEPVSTMAQLLDRCYQYANMFDIMKAQRTADPKVTEKKRTGEKEEKKDSKKQKSDWCQDRDQSPDYTPLNTSRMNILMEIYDRDLLQWPRPMFSKPEDKNKKKYYKFHRDVRHDTEDCRQLKREIEDVIQKGHLQRYVKEDRKDNP
ncbi:uncharacterized protein LOC122638752 [Telopea speciosissima]|uniref:uncharacterized protein LOC122638752 n=1 Tax=Telopea speciosissima TaxID=54955 RepID=UPI001CC7723C|nr:uncharacterized protein LOC122638752 [Telopea speciosissima]